MAELDTTGQIQEFLTVLKRRKWGILLPMLYFLAIGCLIAVVVPKKVEVTTRVELRESRVEADPSQNNAATKEIQSAKNHIVHYNRIKEIIEGPRQDLWELDYMGLDAGEKHTFITDVVMKNLDVHVAEKPATRGPAVGSWFIDIRYKDTDGERAEAFLNELVAHWIDDVLERDSKQLEAEKEQLQQELHDAVQRFAAANANYTLVCQELGVNPAEPLDNKGATDAVAERIGRLKEKQNNLALELVALETSIGQLHKDLEDLPIYVDVETPLPGQQYTEELAKLDEMLRMKKILQEPYKPAHPRWERAQKEIDVLLAERVILEAAEEPDRVVVERERNPEREVTLDSIAKAEALYQAKRQALEMVDSQLNAEESEQKRRARASSRRYVLSVERDALRADRDLKSTLLSQKERAVAASKNNYTKPYDTVQPPEADDAPVTPNTSILVVAFAIAGLGLGLAFSLLAEYGKNAYRSPAELAQVLPIPVLGAINSIVTSHEARRRHARRTLVAVSSLFILGGLGWFTFMIWKRAEDLPVPVQETLDDIRMKLL
ncbi:MAG: hypothetical protein WD226_04540 [Planctomycetota bacterium]